MTTIAAFGISDVGKVREQNEDQFFIGTLHKVLEVQQTSLEATEAFEHFTRTDARILLVADGVGGVSGGRRASQTAVHTLATYIGQTAGCYYDFDVEQEEEFLQRLEHALGRAHEAVRSLGGRSTGPATTVTLAVIIGARVYLAHVGDSRAYHFRAGRLRQVTRDQTMGDFLTNEGVITDAQAELGGLKNVLASAIGGPEMLPSIGILDLAAGDALLLCSDGLTKHVTDDAIREVLASPATPEMACRTLVDAALAGGGSDNVTVVVARAR
jgi:serine/threonine protein phosphatase PrpC